MTNQLDNEEQRGLVVISALINFVDWIDSGKARPLSNIQFSSKIPFEDRGQLVVEFLRSHSSEFNYFKQAEDIAKRLGEPFK